VVNGHKSAVCTDSPDGGIGKTRLTPNASIVNNILA